MSVPAYTTALVTSSLTSRTALSTSPCGTVPGAGIGSWPGGVAVDVIRPDSTSRRNRRACADASWFAGNSLLHTKSAECAGNGITTPPVCANSWREKYFRAPYNMTNMRKQAAGVHDELRAEGGS